MYSELISIIVNLLIAMLIPTAVVLGLTYINRNSKDYDKAIHGQSNNFTDFDD